jgi:hypothetical protein
MKGKIVLITGASSGIGAENIFHSENSQILKILIQTLEWESNYGRAYVPFPLDAGASKIGSHAGAWEPEKSNKRTFIVGNNTNP